LILLFYRAAEAEKKQGKGKKAEVKSLLPVSDDGNSMWK
jgi:hypothetical protein